MSGSERSGLIAGNPVGRRSAIDRARLLANVQLGLFAQPAAPVRVGPYQVQDPLGAGSMGTVYDALDPRLNRRAAVKIIDTFGLTSEAASVALREARALARLHHPNIVEVYDAGRFEHGLWIAMERLDGSTLDRWLAGSGRRTATRIVTLLRAVGRGVQAAHDAGVVHRDIKPRNIFVAATGEPYLIDFGLAIEPTGTRSAAATGTPVVDRRTRPSGTPAYMAPEQHRGEPADARSDQYAWCVVLWEALYGERPFQAAEAGDLLQGKLAPLPARPPRRDVSLALHRALIRGLSPRPAERWRSMAHLLDAIADHRRGRGRFVWTAAVAAVGAGALWASSNEVPDPCSAARSSNDVAAAWDRDRDEVASAIQGDGEAFRVETWRTLQPRLDEHAQRYTDLRRRACRSSPALATASDTDRTLVCLAGWRASFEVLVDALKQVDADSVTRALRWAQDLPDPTECDVDGDELAGRQPPAPPSVKADVSALRAMLAAARQDRSVARFDEALSVLGSIHARADALGFAPLQAEIAAERARTTQLAGNIEAARASLLEAYDHARRGEHPYIELRAAIWMAELVLLKLGDAQTAEEWLGRARAVQASRWPELVVDRLQAEAMALAVQRDYDAAIAKQRAAFARSDGLKDTVRLPTMSRTVWMLLDAGQVEEAYPIARAVVAQRRVAHGPRHPALVHSLVGLAVAASEVGDFDVADDAFGEALRMLGRSYGEDSLNAGIVHVRFADALIQRGEWDDALHQLDLATPAVAGAPRHPTQISWNISRGEAELGREDFAAAIGSFERGTEIATEMYGPGDLSVGWAISGTARARLAAGRDGDAALLELRRAWQILRGTARLGPSVELARVRFALARAQWAVEGPSPAALSMAEDARRLATGASAGTGPLLESIDAWLRARSDR